MNTSRWARCSDGRGSFNHLFFSEDPIELARAKAICARCVLRPACLAGALERKEVVAQQQAIRAAYTDKIRRQGSMMRGGGGLGKFVRNFQHANRDADKRQLANLLTPLDQQKARCDAMLQGIDQSILKAEIYILESSK